MSVIPKDCFVPSFSCWFCKEPSHKLAECRKFMDISMQERIAFAKSSKLCHKCLSSRHRAPDCKRSGTCSIKNCIDQFHHTVLHKPENERKPKPKTRDIETSTADISTPAVCGLSQNSSHSEVYLCVVPV